MCPRLFYGFSPPFGFQDVSSTPAFCVLLEYDDHHQSSDDASEHRENDDVDDGDQHNASHAVFCGQPETLTEASNSNLASIADDVCDG